MSEPVNTADQISAGLLARLWVYQKERFPLGQTAILVGFFTAATLSVSAQLADRSQPALWTFAAVWISVLVIFFQMRACDEYKDLETDQRYRPERAIPRGLVSLKTIILVAILASIIATALTASVSIYLLLPLGFVWIWLFIMTKEFWVAGWLTARPFLYLVSHMAIMPIIDFYISAAEWMDYEHHPPDGLWVFLVLSFLNGCVLEFGRKIWSPENEREGVATYSRLLGPEKAVWIWTGFCALATVFLIIVALKLEAGLWVGIPSVLALIVVLHTARHFSRNPTQALQKKIETIAGLWVVMCYGLAGFMPLLKAWVTT